MLEIQGANQETRKGGKKIVQFSPDSDRKACWAAASGDHL